MYIFSFQLKRRSYVYIFWYTLNIIILLLCEHILKACVSHIELVHFFCLIILKILCFFVHSKHYSYFEHILKACVSYIDLYIFSFQLMPKVICLYILIHSEYYYIIIVWTHTQGLCFIYRLVHFFVSAYAEGHMFIHSDTFQTLFLFEHILKACVQ